MSTRTAKRRVRWEVEVEFLRIGDLYVGSIFAKGDGWCWVQNGGTTGDAKSKAGARRALLDAVGRVEKKK